MVKRKFEACGRGEAFLFSWPEYLLAIRTQHSWMRRHSGLGPTYHGSVDDEVKVVYSSDDAHKRGRFGQVLHINLRRLQQQFGLMTTVV